MKTAKVIGKYILKTTPYLKCGSAVFMLVGTAAEAYVAIEQMKQVRKEQKSKPVIEVALSE